MESAKNVIFTDLNSQKILKLEEDLAYFYGAKETGLIAKHYIEALKQLEIGSDDALEAKVLGHLKKAYAEVQNQTDLVFDLDKAAKYEYLLIRAQSKQDSFEVIYGIMVDLYGEVFGLDKNSSSISKAAMMRTFLYKYKTKILKTVGVLTDGDISLMLMLARASEHELESFE